MRLVVLLLHLNQVILIPDDVLNLIDVDKVYFTKSRAPKVSLDANEVLGVQIALHVVQLPRHILERHALVGTGA